MARRRGALDPRRAALAPRVGPSAVVGVGRVGPLPRLLDTLFEQLREQGVRYCVLRDGSSLDRLQRGGEIDLLADPAHLERLARLLGRLGFAPLPAWGHAPHHFFVAYDVDVDGWWKLDVVDALAYGHPVRALRTSLARTCLDRRRPRGSIFVPSPEDEFLTLLLHCVLDKRAFAPSRARRLQLLCEKVTDEAHLSALLETYWAPGTRAWTLFERVRAEQWSVLLNHRTQLTRRLSGDARTALALRNLRSRALRRLRRRIRPGLPDPVSVALLAPDGAGKSTLAEGLREHFPFPIRCFYMGLYPKGEPRSRLPGLNFARRLLRLWGRYLGARLAQARGSFAIFDRYGYDALLGSVRERSPRRSWRRWLLARACPAPDLVVVLDAPGSLLFARKGEHAAQDLEQRRQAYLELARRLPRSAVVDATQDAEAVRRQVTALIWRSYQQRRLARRSA